MSYQLRAFAKRLVYRLKRAWGGPVDIYQQTGETVDWTIGTQVPTVVKYAIKRAAYLPAQDYNKTLLAKFMKREFRYGGFAEYADRSILVDKHDIPDLTVGIENWYAIIDGTRYQIQKMTDFGDGTAWHIYLSEDSGKREAQVDVSLKQRIKSSSQEDVDP